MTESGSVDPLRPGGVRPPRDDSPEVDELTVHLGDLARSMQGEKDVQDTVDAIVHAAVDTVPGASHASITIVRNRRDLVTQAATGVLPRALDQAQYDTGQGPCLDALLQQRTVRLDDLAGEPRWPAFVARAVELGAGSMLCVQLYVDGLRGNLGALNLSSEQVDAFTDESEEIATVLAAHSAVAMTDAQTAAQLQVAVDSRDLIGMAKGVLVERFRLTPDRAFAVLVRASQHSNRKLLDLSRELVDTGSLDAGPDSPPAGRAGRPGPPGQRQHQRSRTSPAAQAPSSPQAPPGPRPS